MSTILVVDDYAVTQRVLSHKLHHSGHEVVLASNGLQALDQLSQAENQIDLAILDIAMPEMDGLTLLRKLRADPTYQTLPIIMLTASGQDSDRLQAKLDGADAFLTKPVSSWDLTETLDHLLQR